MIETVQAICSCIASLCGFLTGAFCVSYFWVKFVNDFFCWLKNIRDKKTEK